MKVNYRAFKPSQLRIIYGVNPDNDLEKELEILEKLNVRSDILEFLEDDDKGYDGPNLALVRLYNDVPQEIVWREHHVEPEDASLGRDFRWVIDELRFLTNMIEEQDKLIKEMKESINAGVRF